MELSPGTYARLPLRGLLVFEAAARRGTFSGAARELAMTQAAISQHIGHLEAELGVSLFERHHRGVELTAAGERLLPRVEEGLQALATGVASASRHRATRTVTILTDFGFAAWWLMPRIAELTDLMPEVEIRLTTSQGTTDALGSDFDLAVLFGNGQWPGCRAHRLFAEEVHPVCAPSYLAQRPLPLALPLAPADIAQMRLLHLRGGGPTRWFDWPDWFAGMGVPAPAARQDLAFNNYQIVLQAAMLGQGVALGWAPLIDDLVRAGSLVRLTDHPLSSPRGYHLVEPLTRPQLTDTARVNAWLRQTARA
ncbi:LysR substrate-binding domain-containing protein [Novosphingobium sp. SG720]|uniref:choline sulfate utilization transcriptional regulator n=1 Tax=Novosphingobium sp. SG720 TaxID=2586998 RepID=UPI001447E572|nr:putative choline sulfate-utilization transcription factor [Novosphingobium sp. SG720]